MPSLTSLDQLAEAAESTFQRQLGRKPRWLVAAPGRVNLIGEHTDYNDGFVLPMAIDRYVVIAADRPEQPRGPARVYSTAVGQWAEIAVEGASRPDLPAWSSYVQGVVAGFQSTGRLAGPFEAVIHADLPLGGGLSSSAALEMATLTLLEALTGTRLDPFQKVFLCQKAEHDFAGVPCGIMDQTASVLGRADSLLLLDCRSLDIRWIPIADPDVVALILNSNVKHALVQGEYAARRAQCVEASRLLGIASLRDITADQLDRQRDQLDPLLYRRARHVVTENERTVTTAEAIRLGDWQTVGDLMTASHASLRDDYEVSCPELDTLVALAQEIGRAGGVIGSRMTGGGFGGSTISLVQRDAADTIAHTISEGYLRQTGRQATAFTTRPVEGAHILRAPGGASPVPPGKESR